MDEFTFPTIPRDQCKLPFPHFASPPPWFVTSEKDTDAHNHRRSFSAIDQARKTDNDSERFAVDEEKMDMLWEDFNEELARAPPPCPLNKRLEEAWQADATASDEKEKREHVFAGSMVHRRRLSLLLMLKLLKKLFLAQKSSAPRKTPI